MLKGPNGAQKCLKKLACIYILQVVEQLEAKNRELSANMEQQQSANQDSVLRIKSTEKSVFQKDNRLLDLEDELASGDVIRDTLRRDKTKVCFDINNR